MPAASSLLPWFAPRLSRPMIGVLNNLGHEMHYTRGEVLYESPGFFRPLMLVRRGIVARALMDPLHANPLLVSLSGPRALCGSCETLYVQDRMVRRHWCMTSVDVHVVNADLLLRICDQNPLWQRELSNYSAICALSDRLVCMVTHATSLEERLGVLMIACSSFCQSSEDTWSSPAVVTRGYRTLAVAQNSVISTAICRFLESCRTSFTNGCSNRTRFPHKNACKRSGTS